MQEFLTEVTHIEPVARDIKVFTLAPVAGELPAFSAGSHILVRMDDAGRQYANAYSLIDPPRNGQPYRIAVKKDSQSRGGSRFLHERVKQGDRLTVTAPANLFALADVPGPHLFIAGGIGITPFMAHIGALEAVGGDYRLHYTFRDRERAAFVDTLAARQAAGRVQLYDSTAGQRPDVATLLNDITPDTHVYVCGPQGLIDAVTAACTGRLATDRVHVERFAAATPAESPAFPVRLARTGVDLLVHAGESILDAIERQTSVAVESLCREGYCGTCETRLLCGEAVHHDQYLDDASKASQQTIMLCVSRSAGGMLTLDL